MRFVGVDLAAQPERTSICIVDWKATAHVEAVNRPADDERIIRIASGNVVAIGIDSPFGWPEAFVSFVQQGLKHPQHMPLTRDEADRLKYRATDLWLRDKRLPASHNRRVLPLSVSTDKLGAVALRCVRLVQCLESVTENGPTIYEVYPAASLARWMTLDGTLQEE